MIKNIIFDFGEVLYRFVPRDLAAKYVESDEDRDLLAEVLFDRLYWDRLDDGTMDDEEAIRLACERLPERLHEVARKTHYGWIYNMPPMDGMREVLTRVKEKHGVRFFLISNISRYFAEKNEIPEFSMFDKCVFSAVVGMTKPGSEIFEYLLREADILPEESLFVDDREINVLAAEALGIKGYVFDGDAKAFSNYLEKELKE